MNIHKIRKTITYYSQYSQSRFMGDVIYPDKTPFKLQHLYAVVPRQFGATTAIMHRALRDATAGKTVAVMCGTHARILDVINTHKGLYSEHGMIRDTKTSLTHKYLPGKVLFHSTSYTKHHMMCRFRGMTYHTVLFDTDSTYHNQWGQQFHEFMVNYGGPCMSNTPDRQIVVLSNRMDVCVPESFRTEFYNYSGGSHYGVEEKSKN